jgi:hypothetical protein
LYVFSREANPLVDKAEAEILQTYRGTTQTKRKNLKPRKFFPQGSAMGDGRCSILQYTGTDVKTRNTVYKEAL